MLFLNYKSLSGREGWFTPARLPLSSRLELFTQAPTADGTDKWPFESVATTDLRGLPGQAGHPGVELEHHKDLKT